MMAGDAERVYIDHLLAACANAIERAQNEAKGSTKSNNNLLFECLFALFHLTDRYLNGRLGDEERGKLMTRMEQAAIAALAGIVFSGNSNEELEIFANRTLNVMQERNARYGKYSSLGLGEIPGPGTMFMAIGDQLAGVAGYPGKYKWIKALSWAVSDAFDGLAIEDAGLIQSE